MGSQDIENTVIHSSLISEEVVPSTPPTTQEIIKMYFKEDPEVAIAVAKAESRLVVDNIGDEHLTCWHEGELLGRSIGLFQIRTGGCEKNGKVWNRAKKMGLSVKEFEELMKDPEENAKYAYNIYKDAGWVKWSAYTNESYKQFL